MFNELIKKTASEQQSRKTSSKKQKSISNHSQSKIYSSASQQQKHQSDNGIINISSSISNNVSPNIATTGNKREHVNKNTPHNKPKNILLQAPSVSPSKSPDRKSQPNNLISQILDHEVYRQKNLNPQFLRIKNNILLIILLASFYGIYYLFEDFLDVMLLAFIGGVGYQQMQDRFVIFWQSEEPFFQKKMSLKLRLSSIVGYIVLFILLPWIRVLLGNPEDFYNHLSVSDILYTFSFKTNPVVVGLQVVLLLRIFHLILAPQIFPIISRHTPTNAKFYKVLFAISFITIAICSITVIPSVLLMQISYGGFWMEIKVQEHLGCQVINYSTHNNTKLPFCSEVFFNNNTFFEETFKQFKAQTSDIQECIGYISGLEQDFFGYEIFHYEELVCTWYLIIQKATLYFAPDAGVFSTGTTFFKTIFGNIAFIVQSFSNIIFALTTFLTIFYMTIRYFDSRSTVIQEIFFGQRKQLLGQITNLIQATIFIVVEHFIMSIVLLELFNFSYFNMIIATMLSSMAFVPFFRPWFGALFFCLIRGIFLGNILINLIFVVIYYYLSEGIFSSRLKQMEFHQIITNLSVLFGIYQFGIAGIFYGPIIIILFQSVHRELLRNEVYNEGAV